MVLIRILMVCSLFVTVLAPGTSFSEASSNHSDFPEDPVLSDYLGWAWSNHPELIAAEARVEALRWVANEQSSLPDLKLSWGEMIVPVETRVGPQNRVFSLSQTLPWLGTLGLKKAAGMADADAEMANLQGLRLKLERHVRITYFQLALVQGQIKIVGQQLDLARQSEVSLRAVYESGSGAYSKVLGAQMEVGRLQKRFNELEDSILVAGYRLKTAAGMESDSPIPLAEFPESQFGIETFPGRSELLPVLLENHPGLASLRHRENGQRLRHELAGKSSFPKLIFGLDFIMTDPARMPGVVDSGKDPVVAKVAVSLPVWGGKARALKGETTNRLKAAIADRESLRLSLLGDLEEILFHVRDAMGEISLHEQILLPRMQQLVQVSAADFAASRTEFADLLAVRASLLKTEMGRLLAAHKLAIAEADLIALMNNSTQELDDSYASAFTKRK